MATREEIEAGADALYKLEMSRRPNTYIDLSTVAIEAAERVRSQNRQQFEYEMTRGVPLMTSPKGFVTPLGLDATDHLIREDRPE